MVSHRRFMALPRFRGLFARFVVDEPMKDR